MKNLLVLIACACLSTGALASKCEEAAVGKDGKPLHGAARASFMKKCEQENHASPKASCESRAVDKNGNPLHGAAKAASIKKCLSEN